jgi:hypothetical protein
VTKIVSKAEQAQLAHGIRIARQGGLIEILAVADF